MHEIDFFREIETKYDVQSIRVKDMQVWPFLRCYYYSAYVNKHIFGIERPKEKSLRTKIKRVKNIFYGSWNLLKKYNYMVFSDVLEIRLMNNRYVNKLAGFLISELGERRVLLIENPAERTHFERSKLSTKNVVSLDFFLAISYIPSLRRRFDIKNEMILKEINRRYSINVDYRKLISSFICYKTLFSLSLRIHRPRLVFMTDYFGRVNQAVIYAAKKLGISTIELQHGTIDKNHPGYNVFAKLDKAFFPNYLFAFGDHVRNIFGETNYFIQKDNVFPVGSMYIDYINNEYKASEETKKKFSSFMKKYQKIVAVSSQVILERRLIDFLGKSATLSKDVLYVFVPRNSNSNYSDANFPENIVILRDLDFYQIVKEVNFHATVFSTCALEAPSLGIPNILLNIDGLAKKHYSDTLVNRDVTRFVDREEEFVDLVLSWHPRTKKEIMSLHHNFYKQDHKESIKKALEIIENRRRKEKYLMGN